MTPRATRLSYLLLLMAMLTSTVSGQQPPGPLPSHVTIPFLANATKPADIDFMAAQCNMRGDRMDCRFRQVFLTPSSPDASSCAITTSGFELSFRRDTPVRWVNRSAPTGACGVVETTVLEDGGGTRWTLTIEAAPTQGLDRTECHAAPPALEIYDWRTVKRTLPCTSVQPGSIER